MKRALCVGINDYPVRGADLKGCVNDAKSWARLLEEHYRFEPANVTMLLNKQATKQAILAALDALIAGSKRGDVVVFTNSSHGTYVADTDGDEPMYDEAMCPYDMKKNLIVDDELRVRFAKIPSGVHLTVISDSCFSGSVTRLVPELTPDERRPRFVPPSVIGRAEIPGVRQVARPRSAEKHPQSKMREVLVTGCRDDQYSYDARIGRHVPRRDDVLRHPDHRRGQLPAHLRPALGSARRPSPTERLRPGAAGRGQRREQGPTGFT